MAKDETRPAAGGGARGARGRFQMVPSGGPVGDLYADGIAGVVSRAGVVKIDLYQVAGYKPDSNAEMRRVAHRLVMPMTAVPELLRIFQNMLQRAQAQGAAAGAAEADAPGAEAPARGGRKKGAAKRK